MLDILQEKLSMNLLIDLVFLHLKFWMGGICVLSCKILCLVVIEVSYFFLDIYHVSSDEVAACKSLLEKVGLEGYQVIIQWLISLFTDWNSTVFICPFCNCTFRYSFILARTGL